MLTLEHRANFDTLLRAAKDGTLTLVECKDADSGEYRAVICALPIDGSSSVTPFGHLSNGNAFAEYLDPVESMTQDEAALS